MEPGEIVQALLDERGRSRRSLARQVGLPPQTLDGLLTGRSPMALGEWVELLDALGYELRIVPREEGGR